MEKIKLTKKEIEATRNALRFYRDDVTHAPKRRVKNKMEFKIIIIN